MSSIAFTTGLPVFVEVHDDGTVTIDVDVSEVHDDSGWTSLYIDGDEVETVDPANDATTGTAAERVAAAMRATGRGQVMITLRPAA